MSEPGRSADNRANSAGSRHPAAIRSLHIGGKAGSAAVPRPDRLTSAGETAVGQWPAVPAGTEVAMMSMTELPPEERLSAGDLIAEMLRKTPAIGPNESQWPGLTAYRFTAPMSAQWNDVQSLSLCFVIQGRKRVIVDGEDFLYDPFSYLVFTRGQRFQAEILQASPELPFLSFVLQVDPAIVRRVTADMVDRVTTTLRRPPPQAARRAFISPVDQNTLGAVLRFLRAVDSGPDRRVLAPMYLQEIVYRVLQAEQCARLIEAASSEHEQNPITTVVGYIRAHMSEPLTVADLAETVCMSPSAFAHLFREVTGMAPYQFLKSVRLDQARTLLVENNLGVGEIAKEVGYSSLSHFINEFKRHFGVTPRAYADAQRHAVQIAVGRATSRQ